MQDYNTIIGVIVMRQNGCSFSVIQSKYHIGSGTAQRILDRFKDSGFTLKELKAMEPQQVEEVIYPPANLQRKFEDNQFSGICTDQENESMWNY